MFVYTSISRNMSNALGYDIINTVTSLGGRNFSIPLQPNGIMITLCSLMSTQTLCKTQPYIHFSHQKAHTGMFIKLFIIVQNYKLLKGR